MKPRIFILVVLAALTAAVIGFKPAVLALLQKEIHRQIPGSKVAVGGCEISLHQTSCWDVLIRKPDVFDFKAREINLQYTLLSLLNQDVPAIAINGASIVYQKLNVENIQARGWLKARIYSIHVTLSDLPLTDVVRAFKLEKKLDWQGSLSGEVNLSGEGQNIRILNGNFTAGDRGGMMVIKDTGFLENMARNSKLPVNIVVDSFKNYHYDKGMVKASLEPGNILVLDAALKGKAGKRNLKINLHNFNLK